MLLMVRFEAAKTKNKKKKTISTLTNSISNFDNFIFIPQNPDVF